MEMTTGWVSLIMHVIFSLLQLLVSHPQTSPSHSISTSEIKWEIREVKDDETSAKPNANFIWMAGWEEGKKYQVSKKVLLAPQYFKSVTWQVKPGNNGEMHLEINLTEKGSLLFAKISRLYLNKELALIANGKVISIPKVMSKMTEGKIMVAFPLGKHPPLEKLLTKEK